MPIKKVSAFGFYDVSTNTLLDFAMPVPNFSDFCDIVNNSVGQYRPIVEVGGRVIPVEVVISVKPVKKVSSDN